MTVEVKMKLLGSNHKSHIIKSDFFIVVFFCKWISQRSQNPTEEITAHLMGRECQT